MEWGVSIQNSKISFPFPFISVCIGFGNWMRFAVLKHSTIIVVNMGCDDLHSVVACHPWPRVGEYRQPSKAKSSLTTNKLCICSLHLKFGHPWLFVLRIWVTWRIPPLYVPGISSKTPLGKTPSASFSLCVVCNLFKSMYNRSSDKDIFSRRHGIIFKSVHNEQIALN